MRELIAVSKGELAADYFFSGGYVLDVYNGDLLTANLAVKGQRIAYMGPAEGMVGETTSVIDLNGQVLVPGYIEPHAHPFTMYHPLTFADEVLKWGTTTSVNDDLLFMSLLTPEKTIAMVEAICCHPHKMLWSARLDSQSFSEELAANFTEEAVSRLIKHQGFIQVGELTDWPSLVGGDNKMQQWMLEAIALGKRAEGHAPGASERTLNSLVAAGVTACHESITAEEVLRRLRLGMYATLRNSSLRPDLANILEGLLQHGHLAWERMMMTTDAPKAAFFKHGFNDHLIRIAIEKGVEPITAYQLMTRNPAVYLGLDNEIGGLAPGRIADILVLKHLEEPTPVMVFADGKLAVERKGSVLTRYHPNITVDWHDLGIEKLKQPGIDLDSIDFRPIYEGETSFPVIELIDPVITRLCDHKLGKEIVLSGDRLSVEKGQGLCYGALISRDFKLITHGIIKGLADDLDGLATSYTPSLDLLVLGQDPRAMLIALKRAFVLGGGLVVVQGKEIVAEIALPLAGCMSMEPMEHVISATVHIEAALQAAGYPHHDLFYTLQFLSSTHLPGLRLTREGLFEAKSRKLIRSSRRLLG